MSSYCFCVGMLFFLQMQRVVTAYMKSRQLQFFVFVGLNTEVRCPPSPLVPTPPYRPLSSITSQPEQFPRPSFPARGTTRRPCCRKRPTRWPAASSQAAADWTIAHRKLEWPLVAAVSDPCTSCPHHCLLTVMAQCWANAGTTPRPDHCLISGYTMLA